MGKKAKLENTPVRKEKSKRFKRGKEEKKEAFEVVAEDDDVMSTPMGKKRNNKKQNSAKKGSHTPQKQQQTPNKKEDKKQKKDEKKESGKKRKRQEEEEEEDEGFEEVKEVEAEDNGVADDDEFSDEGPEEENDEEEAEQDDEFAEEGEEGEKKEKKPKKSFDKGGKDDKKKVLTKEDKKKREQERKAARPNAEIVSTARNEMWKDSIKKASGEDKVKRVQDALTALEPKLLEIATRHDSSRLLQAMIKYGNPEQRETIAKKLEGNLEVLIKDKYAVFVVKKIAQYGTPARRAAIMTELKGHIHQLSLHQVASRFLQYLYTSEGVLTAVQRKALIQEHYGPEYRILRGADEPPITLPQIAQQGPEKKFLSAVASLLDFINRAVHKSQLHLAVVHTLLSQFFAHAHLKEIQEVISSLAPNAVELTRSNDGYQALLYAISYGSAKDRKAIIKSLKGHVAEMCQHIKGFLSVIKLLDVVDDTVLLKKAVTVEIEEAFESIVMNKYGVKTILHILSPRNPKLFSPGDMKQLENPRLYYKDEVESVVVSKKDPAVRRAELLTPFFDRLCDYLLQPQVIGSLLTSTSCQTLLYEALPQAAKKGKDAWAKLADAACGNDFAPIRDPAGHRAVKRLILLASPEFDALAAKRQKTDKGAAPVIAHAENPLAALIQPRIIPRIAALLESHAVFVLISLIECGGDAVATAIKQALKPYVKTLNSSSKQGCMMLAALVKQK